MWLIGYQERANTVAVSISAHHLKKIGDLENKKKKKEEEKGVSANLFSVLRLLLLLVNIMKI